MKRIAVIGLGIIGGSICAALTKAGYVVDGFDRNDWAVKCALELGYIHKKAENLADYDVVFIAVPVSATLDYLENGEFKNGALVMDICGVKSAVEEAVYAKERNYRYVGLHPMAGKETSGIHSATSELFKKANLIVCISSYTSAEDLAQAKEFATAMRFGKIMECSAKEHDAKIALTSQLAHIVSNAYVKSGQVPRCEGFTGGSFQDMTRIAGVDEKMWTELYMNNRDFLLEELDGLIAHLNVYRDAIAERDAGALSDALREGRLIRENIKHGRD